jgi:hypothetical protein
MVEVKDRVSRTVALLALTLAGMSLFLLSLGCRASGALADGLNDRMFVTVNGLAQ